MGCPSWLEGSCGCDQPCDMTESVGIDDYVIDVYKNDEIIAINPVNMDVLKDQFKALASLVEQDFCKAMVWGKIETIASILDVDINQNSYRHQLKDLFR